MKISKIILSGLGFVAACSLFMSCQKDQTQVAELQTDIAGSATIQVINVTLKAARNYVYVDNKAVSGAAFAYQAAFPASTYSFKVSAGSHAILIKDTLSTTTQLPISFTQSFDAGNYYTVFMYDTIPTAKQVTVVNNVTVPADTTARLRFANFVYNPTAIANVDVYSYRRIPGTPAFQSTAVLNNAAIQAPVFTGSTPIFSNVPTNQVTGFIPYASQLSDTLYVFAAGTTTPLLVKGTITSLTPTRSYTSTYNGSYRGNLAAKAVTTFATY